MNAHPAPTVTSLEHWLQVHEAELIRFRRDLHAHPELSGEEYRTTAAVTELLRNARLTSRVLAIGTGAVCDVGGTSANDRTIALRADLDGLAMDDETGTEHRSTVAGVAHACGHDVHTTVVLGTGLYFAAHPEELEGGLRLIFQPAEERVPGGALDVIGDGGIDGVDAIIGVHCEPKLDVGMVAVKDGSISSAADMAEIRICGPGGHTARPELTVDTITLAGNVITDLPRLVGEKVAALTGDGHQGDGPLVKLVFGAMQGGDAANVIPTECVLRASVRTPDLGIWDQLAHIVAASLDEILGDTAAQFTLSYTHGVPPVVNDAGITATVRRAASDAFGSDKIDAAVQSWGGDDFAWYTREIPGTYVRLGVHDPDSGGPKLDLHAGTFDVDERAIAHGIRTLVSAVKEFHRRRERRVMTDIDGTWVFGYGSLVSPTSMAQTIGRTIDPVTEYRAGHLASHGRRWNYGSKVKRGHWTHDGVDVRFGLVISLGLVQAPDESCNGVAFKVTSDELAALDWRERDYERRVVTDLVQLEGEPIDGDVNVYFPRPTSIERYEVERDAGTAGIMSSYWNLCIEAFSSLGSNHAELYAQTPPPDIPVVDIELDY